LSGPPEHPTAPAQPARARMIEPLGRCQAGALSPPDRIQSLIQVAGAYPRGKVLDHHPVLGASHPPGRLTGMRHRRRETVGTHRQGQWRREEIYFGTLASLCETGLYI
jgi:hypothetical protein